jgi:flagellin
MDPVAGISQTSSLQQTLDGLTQTQGDYASAQTQLQTGRNVSNPLDNAIAYFQAASLTGRAAQALNYKSGLDQGVSSIDTALTATSAVEGLLKQLQGVIEGAEGGSLAARTRATQQFQAISTQIGQIIQDASYQGLNLLNSTAASLSVTVNPQGGSLQAQGYDLTATAGGARSLYTAGGTAFGTVGGFSALDILAGTAAGAGTVAVSVAKAIFDQTVSRVSNAITQLQSIAGSLGSAAQGLQARAVFQQSYGAQLEAGAQKLTLADLNQSAAHSQASNLRIELGLQSAALQGQIRSSVLQLLRAPSAQG